MGNKNNNKIIAKVFGSMVIEGINCTEEDRYRAIDILTGNKSTDDVVKELISKHTPKAAVGK